MWNAREIKRQYEYVKVRYRGVPVNWSMLNRSFIMDL